jgi:hypothetical protein
MRQRGEFRQSIPKILNSLSLELVVKVLRCGITVRVRHLRYVQYIPAVFPFPSCVRVSLPHEARDGQLSACEKAPLSSPECRYHLLPRFLCGLWLRARVQSPRATARSKYAIENRSHPAFGVSGPYEPWRGGRRGQTGSDTRARRGDICGE